MKWTFATWIALVMTAAPAVVFANPNVESREPSSWMFVLMGPLPLMMVGWKLWRSNQQETAPARVKH